VNKTQVIINGDDFGRSPEVNEAVIRSFRTGTLSSCSLMVTGDAFEHAVRLALENPDLAVGIHLVTVQGKAVLPYFEIPSLVDREGRFSQSPTAAGLKYYFLKKARRQLRRELTAQFQRFHATGLRLSHVDSHLHMHVHPVIFGVAVELAERYGVRRMRVPQDDFQLALRFSRLATRSPNPRLPPPGVATGGGERVTRRHSGEGPVRPPFLKGGWGDFLGGASTDFVFRLLTNRMKRQLRDRGFIFAERVYGHFHSGHMTREYVLFVLDHLSTRTNEIYFHPEELESGVEIRSDRRQGARELEILTNSRFKKRLHDPDIHLTNYLGLAYNK
jgi:chitin disaccharide deacetylase